MNFGNHTKTTIIHALLLILAFTTNCHSTNPSLKVIDTDFSKGRLIHIQEISLDDLVKFHGHKCDGLVLGFLALKFSFQEIFPDGVVDRTNLRIVSKSGPCIGDAAVYLTGGRYQFNTFYVSNEISFTYIIQKIDTKETWGVKLKPGVFPERIGKAGKKAVAGQLNSCELQELKEWEDEFSDVLLSGDISEYFVLEKLDKFSWKPVLKNTFPKTDVINKNKEACNE